MSISYVNQIPDKNGILCQMHLHGGIIYEAGETVGRPKVRGGAVIMTGMVVISSSIKGNILKIWFHYY